MIFHKAPFLNKDVALFHLKVQIVGKQLKDCDEIYLNKRSKFSEIKLKRQP